MGAVAAAIIGAPLTMVFLVLEATGDFQVTIAVVIAVIVASTIVRIMFGYSFATWRFHLRGIGIRGAHDVGWIADLTVGRLMRTDAKIVPETMSLASSAKNIRRAAPSACSSCRTRTAPSSARSTSARCMTRPSRGGRDRRSPRDFALDADRLPAALENVRTALTRFEEKEVETLPVLVPAGDRQWSAT